jgi:Xaa-Pro aminopeptidase
MPFIHLFIKCLGTTDVTRTIFLGEKKNITDYQKDCFTRVLKGHIQLGGLKHFSKFKI